MDGASNCKDTGIGIVVMTLERSIIEQSYTLDSLTTNNETEYEAVITGLRMAVMFGVTILDVHFDSLLVTSLVNKDYVAKDE